MKFLFKTGLLLAAVGVSGCATKSQQSETLGLGKNQVKTFTCEYQVLYKQSEKKNRVQKNVRPYFYDGQWIMLVDSSSKNHTKMTTAQCKNMAASLEANFRLGNGIDEVGQPREDSHPEVMAVLWQSKDTTFGDDSHGIFCTDAIKNSPEKNEVYNAFKYSCGHEYIRPTATK